MLINIEATKSDFEPAMNCIGGLIGAAVDKRVAGFERQERNNPLLSAHFREIFALEYALAQARKYRKNTGRAPSSEEYHPLYSFLIPARRIHSALPREARSPFEGRLRDAVNGTFGARPFAYEISIATHLMRKNWDVEFSDYSGTAQFDLLARQGAVEVEIECKTTSGDTGRKIHRQEVNRLADQILPTTERLAQSKGCHLVRVTMPNRLGKSVHELSCTATTFAEAAERKGSAASDHAIVDYSRRDLTSWPEPGRDPGAREFFENQFGLTNCHFLFHGRPDHAVVAVAIVSSKADTVVEAIADQAKEAAEQCSGKRPALIALDLVDQIGKTELQTLLNTANGLHAITHAVFKKTERLHVDSLAFTVPQTARTESGATWLSGSAIVLNNPNPQFPCSEIRSIFQSAPGRP
jgi:hypothetical protein